jgi:hypothetical protein
VECSHTGWNEADVLFRAMVDFGEPLPNALSSLLPLMGCWCQLVAKGYGRLPR